MGSLKMAKAIPEGVNVPKAIVFSFLGVVGHSWEGFK